MTIRYRRHCIIIVVALGLIVPFPDVYAGEVRVLSLAEALNIADERNYDVLKAREYLEWTNGKYMEERAAALPQITAAGTAQRSRDKSQLALDPSLVGRQTAYGAQIGLSQTLFSWGQVGAAIRAARIGMQSSSEGVRLARQAARRDVTEAFLDVLLAKELLIIAGESLTQKQRRLDEVQERYRAGVATDYDVLASRVSMENERPVVIRAENLIRVTLDRLRFLLGLEGEDIDVCGSLEVIEIASPAFEQSYATALENRPDLRALRHRIAMSGEYIRIVDALDKPRLDLTGSYGWLGSRTDVWTGVADASDRERIDSHGGLWTVGLNVTWPFFDGLKSHGKTAQARSDLKSLALEEKKQHEAVALQIRQSVNGLKEAGEVLMALAGTVSQAERLRAMAQQGYELGVKIRLEVEDAELNLNQARGSLSSARRDYLVAQTNHAWAMGVLGESSR